MQDKTLQKQIQAAFLGFSAGDALGVPVEFRKRGSFEKVTEMIGYGTHMQEPGSWSDDSSMTFCTAESLINGFDVTDMASRFCDWYYGGYWTHNQKRPFDIGITTSEVLHRIQRGINSGVTGNTDEYSNGNGSLMRVLPLLFYISRHPNMDKWKLIEDVSSITHAHKRSIIACAIYIEVGLHLLEGKTIQEAYNEMKGTIRQSFFNGENHDETSAFHRILNTNLADAPVNEIRSSGYVIDTLEASLWCLLTTETYRDAVEKAVHLGDDTDTTGAVTGGLAGIMYGIDGIPQSWLEKLFRKDDIEDLAVRFANSLR